MKSIITKEFIPLGICILLLLFSGIKVITSNYVLSTKHYVCILLILICIIAYLKNVKAYLYIFTITLFLGLLSFIDIFYTTYAFGIEGIFSLNPIFMILIILFFITNKDRMNEIFQN